MKGKGKVYAGAGSNPLKEFHGKRPKNTPDHTLKRGGGPLFRKRGGKVMKGDGDGDECYATGGAIAGKAAKPSLGRPGRRRGGGVGADTHPVSSAEREGAAKDGAACMPDSERTP